MVSVERTLTPLGDVSRLLGILPDQIEQVAEKLALTLPLRLRGVLYFDPDSIERIRLHLVEGGCRIPGSSQWKGVVKIPTTDRATTASESRT